MGATPNRRDFLKLGGGVIAAAALARCSDGLARGEFAVGDVSSFELDSITRFDEGPFFVLRDEGGLYAMSAVCTHNGCTLDAGAGELTCPCHDWIFDLDGAVVVGSTSPDLEHFPVTVGVDGGVVVDTTRSVAASTRTAVS